jgi:hypothetical protein
LIWEVRSARQTAKHLFFGEVFVENGKDKVARERSLAL